MQYMDENESDDHDMKNNQQSAKICVMDHKIDEARDDERVQISSKESSRVVTPIVTGKTDCEESDWGQRRSSIKQTLSRACIVKDRNSPEISLTRSLGTKNSAVCSTKTMYIYQRKPPRQSLLPKGV